MIKLTKRLKICADKVREGAALADIGCDHGYVPVYLIENGKIKYAVAADINEGPLTSCRSLVASCGFEDKIKCVLSNGFEKIDVTEIDDILIAGMGGELIAQILEGADDLKDKHIILNPATHPEFARKWLFENGFSIKSDIVFEDLRHHYSVFDAYYTGEFKAVSDESCFLGEIKDYSDREYFVHLLNYLKNKEKGGADYSSLISLIEERIK